MEPKILDYSAVIIGADGLVAAGGKVVELRQREGIDFGCHLPSGRFAIRGTNQTGEWLEVKPVKGHLLGVVRLEGKYVS